MHRSSYVTSFHNPPCPFWWDLVSLCKNNNTRWSCRFIFVLLFGWITSYILIPNNPWSSTYQDPYPIKILHALYLLFAWYYPHNTTHHHWICLHLQHHHLSHLQLHLHHRFPLYHRHIRWIPRVKLEVLKPDIFSISFPFLPLLCMILYSQTKNLTVLNLPPNTNTSVTPCLKKFRRFTKITLGLLFHVHQIKMWLDLNGFFGPSIMLMEQLIDIK